MLRLNHRAGLAAMAILLVLAGGCASWPRTPEEVYDPSEKLNPMREDSFSYSLYPNRNP